MILLVLISIFILMGLEVTYDTILYDGLLMVSIRECFGEHAITISFIFVSTSVLNLFDLRLETLLTYMLYFIYIKLFNINKSH